MLEIGVADTQTIDVAEQKQPFSIIICPPHCAVRSNHMF